MMKTALLLALALLAACTETRPRAPSGRTYCGGIMDGDLGDAIHDAKPDQRFYAMIDFRSDRPSPRGGAWTDIVSCSGTFCFAYATKRQLFELCDWVGVRRISKWDPNE